LRWLKNESAAEKPFGEICSHGIKAGIARELTDYIEIVKQAVR
jgi:hypothetical protein